MAFGSMALLADGWHMGTQAAALGVAVFAYVCLSSRVHSKNDHTYTYGPALLWSIHGEFLPAKRIALDLGVDGRYAAVDEEDGANVVNTGGTVVSVALGGYLNGLGGAWPSSGGRSRSTRTSAESRTNSPVQYQVL